MREQRYLEIAYHDAERNVEVPATILLPDDIVPPPIFVSSALVTALFKLLDAIETEATDHGDEELADMCRVRFDIMVAGGLEVSFEAPTSDEVH